MNSTRKTSKHNHLLCNPIHYKKDIYYMIIYNYQKVILIIYHLTRGYEVPVNNL